jgi:hypothetical protein
MSIKPLVEQSMAETLDIAICPTSRFFNAPDAGASGLLCGYFKKIELSLPRFRFSRTACIAQ